MKELGTAIQKLMFHEPALVIRPTCAVLKYQTDNAAYSQPEGVAVDSPVHLTGVAVREEYTSTALDAGVIF
jgi:hypothetical protein